MNADAKSRIINRAVEARTQTNAATLAKCWNGQFDSQEALREYKRSERNFENTLVRAGILH